MAEQTPVTQQPGGAADFSSGLFDVCADTKTAVCALFNPFFGCGLAKRMGGENASWFGGCAAGPVIMRSVYRTKHGIEGDICMDMVYGGVCGPCNACQLSRQLDSDGVAENWCGFN